MADIPPAGLPIGTFLGPLDISQSAGIPGAAAMPGHPGWISLRTGQWEAAVACYAIVAVHERPSLSGYGGVTHLILSGGGHLDVGEISVGAVLAAMAAANAQTGASPEWAEEAAP